MVDFPVDQSSIKTIDARGLACPLPLLKLKQGLNKLVAGECLQIFVTDPASVRDFHAFAELSCHCLKYFEEDGEIYHYIFVKGTKTVA